MPITVFLRYLIIFADMAAGEAASGTTGATSTGWLESGWLKLCLDQEVLWSLVGYQKPFGDSFFQAARGM